MEDEVVYEKDIVDNREFPTELAISIFYTFRTFCYMPDDEFFAYMKDNNIWKMLGDKNIVFGFLGADEDDIFWYFGQFLPRDKFDQFMNRFYERNPSLRREEMGVV